MPQPRIPTAILQAKGSFQHDPARGRARADEPQPAEPLGDPPECLDRDEKDMWHYVASLLPDGVAFSTDRLAMERLVCLLVKARRKIATSADESLIASYLAKWGMTPADRSRIHAVQPKQTDEWDDLDKL
jgi:hypothetical protein